jgi:hypothetical protein
MALQKQTDKKYQWLLPLGNVCMLLSKYLDPSTNETDHYDTAEISLKVAINNHIQNWDSKLKWVSVMMFIAEISLKVALNTTYRIETLWFK